LTGSACKKGLWIRRTAGFAKKQDCGKAVFGPWGRKKDRLELSRSERLARG